MRQEGYDYFESENEYETDQEYQSDSKSSSKRERSQDESSYFDKYTKRKDDDETGPSSGSKSTAKSMPSARRYHYQTRQTTRRTRSAYKKYKSNDTKTRSVKASHRSKRLVRKTTDPSHGLTPYYASINSATIKGQKQRHGIPPERLMKAWKIDRDTAVRTIRAKSQR